MKQLLINRRATHVPVVIADTIVRRTIGLMGEKRGSYALLLPHCRSIHTFFMRYPIQVICIDKHNRIVHILPSCKPWRFFWYAKKTQHILEIPVGFSHDIHLKVGDHVDFAD